MVQLKRCSSRCHKGSRFVPVDQFTKCRRHRDGLQGSCKKCDRVHMRSIHEATNAPRQWKHAYAFTKGWGTYHKIKGNKWSDANQPHWIVVKLERAWQRHVRGRGVRLDAELTPQRKIRRVRQIFDIGVRRRTGTDTKLGSTGVTTRANRGGTSRVHNVHTPDQRKMAADFTARGIPYVMEEDYIDIIIG